jgi:ABC-2 type transport system permease protein
MMLAALVRFPLIFISGIFIPLSELTEPGVFITYASPLTYLVDGLNASLGQVPFLGWAVDLLLLVLFTLAFLYGATKVLQRNMMKGL